MSSFVYYSNQVNTTHPFYTTYIITYSGKKSITVMLCEASSGNVNNKVTRVMKFMVVGGGQIFFFPSNSSLNFCCVNKKITVFLYFFFNCGFFYSSLFVIVQNQKNLYFQKCYSVIDWTDDLDPLKKTSRKEQDLAQRHPHHLPSNRTTIPPPPIVILTWFITVISSVNLRF